jgi:hypothetical protein
MYRVWRKPQDRESPGRTTRWSSRRLLLQNHDGHGIWNTRIQRRGRRGNKTSVCWSVLVVYCSAMRRHSIAHTVACWVRGQGSKDDAHLQIARVCREQVEDDRKRPECVSLGQLRLTNAPHATQRGARRRQGEFVKKCRKKAGANCLLALRN